MSMMGILVLERMAGTYFALISIGFKCNFYGNYASKRIQNKPNREESILLNTRRVTSTPVN